MQKHVELDLATFKRNRLNIATQVVLVLILTAIVSPASAAYTVKPKVGQCFLLTSAQVANPYATNNPINCSKTHNAETFLMAKWPLTTPPEELPDGDGLDVAASLCKAWGKGGVLEGYDFTYWAWYTPDPKAWARGERWLRCDGMIPLTDTEPRKFKSWKGLKFKGKMQSVSGT